MSHNGQDMQYPHVGVAYILAIDDNMRITVSNDQLKDSEQGFFCNTYICTIIYMHMKSHIINYLHCFMWSFTVSNTFCSLLIGG